MKIALLIWQSIFKHCAFTNLREHSKHFHAMIPMSADEGALENIEDILRVDGLDVVFLGANDLSASMGCG
jgi:2-keto-3-deoxy-L-rhamnonate aldolase RhmA